MTSFKISLIFIILVYLQFFSNSISQQTNARKYFLDKAHIQIKPFSLQTARNGQLLTSNMEIFRDLYESTKYLVTQQYYSDFNNNYKYIVNTGKVQRQINLNEPFPCGVNNTRSSEPPSSVHRLRPGDIDIIGAMGDSLTAGSSMMSRTFIQLLIEFRGHTVLGGGLKDWRSFLTLPNILKVFNPNLYGYAVANTLAKFRGARFNVAEPFATMQDMPYMAEVLIKRLQTDPKVDMAKHWKMISIFIGANDICNDMCFYDNLEDFLENYRKDLHITLTILRDNVPRLIVNIISIPDLDNILHTTQAPDTCNVMHKVSCHCFVGTSITPKQLKERHKAVKRLQQINMEVASLPEFQLEEFTAVPRNMAANKTLRYFKNGRTDWRFFAIDCFHFSQYGNAGFTTMLWNDMLQVETKPYSTFLQPFEIFACPTKEKPYIGTLKNK